MTGFSEADYRVAGIYRDQWGWAALNSDSPRPFVTFSGSFDMRVLQDKLKDDLFGVGAMIYNDRTGEGSLSTLNIMASAAYHKKLGSRHFIALGLQGGYVQKSVEINKLVFPSQFRDNGFDVNASNGENVKSGNVGYVDINTGLLWHGRLTDKIGLFNGFSLFHLTQPKENFLNAGDEVNRLSSRFVIHGGGKFQLTDKVYLTPNYIVMLQSKAREINLGTAVEYHFRSNAQDPVIVGLGGWYRLVDAAIASASVEYKNVRLGLAYDFNVSDLQAVSNGRGGFEISLIYLGFLPQATSGPVYVPCPRM